MVEAVAAVVIYTTLGNLLGSRGEEKYFYLILSYYKGASSR
jgi:hypothetical protein